MSSWICCSTLSSHLILATVVLASLTSGHASHGHDLNSTQVTLAIPAQLYERISSTTASPSAIPHISYPPTNQLSELVSSSFEPFLVELSQDGEPNFKLSEGSPVLSSSDETPNTTCSDKPLVMTYYPDWIGSSFPPDKIDFKRFDWIDFAFAVPKSDFTLAWDDDSAPQLLKALITLAHGQGAKVKLSIGGWTGSRYFSAAVASDHNRAIFVQNILATYNSFGLDGIDIDWEYPGREGASGNHFHSTDSENFLSFLELLRVTLPPAARITAAVETTTFAGPEGKSMIDLGKFAEVLDWVLIMNYDVWGSSSNPGPNAPLHDACNNSTQPDANAVAAYNAWTNANFPACKLVLGLPSYGYISSSIVEHLRTRSKPRKKHQKVSGLRIVSDDGGDDSQVQFRELVKQGALIQQNSASAKNNTASRTFLATEGFERRWDDCSDTPFLRSTASGQIITYDDPESLAMKAAFAKEVGMLGVNLFDVHGDTDEWDLIDSIRKSMGLV